MSCRRARNSSLISTLDEDSPARNFFGGGVGRLDRKSSVSEVSDTGGSVFLLRFD